MGHEECLEQNSCQSEPHPLVIGIGNPLRNDDGAGPAVIRGLRAAFEQGSDPCPWDLLECHGDPASLIEVLKDRSCVLLIDAVTSGSPTGALHLLDAAQPLPAALFSVPSTHNLGLPESLELARAFEQLPPDVKVLGIEAEDMGYGTAFSSGVDKAIKHVIRTLLQLARTLRHPPTHFARDLVAPEGEVAPTNGSELSESTSFDPP